MHWQSTPYTLPLILSTALSAGLAGFVLRKRSTSGARSFVILMLALAEWSLGYAFQTADATLPGKLFWSNVAYIGIVTVPGIWLLFAIQYAGGARGLGKLACVLLAVEPSLFYS